MPLTNMTPALVEAIDFASDGTYLALRLMYQDVAAFNRFLNDNAKQLANTIGRSQADTVEWLAAKMLGRWRGGEPLILSPNQPNAQLRVPTPSTIATIPRARWFRCRRTSASRTRAMNRSLTRRTVRSHGSCVAAWHMGNCWVATE